MNSSFFCAKSGCLKMETVKYMQAGKGFYLHKRGGSTWAKNKRKSERNCNLSRKKLSKR